MYFSYLVLFYCNFIWFYLTCLNLINGDGDEDGILFTGETIQSTQNYRKTAGRRGLRSPDPLAGGERLDSPSLKTPPPLYRPFGPQTVRPLQ